MGMVLSLILKELKCKELNKLASEKLVERDLTLGLMDAKAHVLFATYLLEL